MPLTPLDVECPHCHAAPGQKCKNYRGKTQGEPHRDRKKAADPQAEHWRQARLKTERERQKVLDEVPLFAEQALAETRTVEENFRRTRHAVALIKENGEPYAGFHEKWNEGLLRRLARQHLPPEVFASLCESKWKGDPVRFWRDVLTTNRAGLGTFERVSEGWRPVTNADGSLMEIQAGPDRGRLVYVERVRLVPKHGWPPPDRVPPFTPDEIRALLDAPPPLDFGDDGGLARAVDLALARARGEAAP